uniref:Cytochrome b5 type B n=1 Tax=Salmo trutta TaxID=8032 RepID=A0A674D5C8_SALTR
YRTASGTGAPSPEETADSDVTYYTLEEVKTHNTITDAWLIIHDKVYNVTSFLQEHPGGVEIVMMEAGADATESFESVGHSPDARGMLIQFYIGELQMVEIAFSQSLQMCFSWITWLMHAIVAVVVGIMHRCYTKERKSS